MSAVVTHCVAFLVGTLTGAAGKYLADRYTDRRRRKETESESMRRFRRIQKQMPELIAEMKRDLSHPEHRLVREFFLSSRRWTLASRGRSFIYYQEDHSDLQNKVHILENVGYVVDVTPGDAPKYRMTEEFVGLILGSD